MRGAGRRRIVADGLLLVGDSAGLANPRSGEGIRPAVESGIAAAETIIACNRDYGMKMLKHYTGLLARTLGAIEPDARAIPHPGAFAVRLGGLLFRNRWFSRSVLLNRRFLGAAGSKL